MIINLPIDVENIIERLEFYGFEAYAVGGCVRDSLLGKSPCDWDICTSAKPNETIECFSEYNVIETGIKHGTVTVIMNNKPYEITTFRIDGLYQDNRRPDLVTYVSSLDEDLARRDFTINAMAYNITVGLYDLFDGCDDLVDRKIKCVGNPDKRFQEDALRMMRALRFASALGFTIDLDTSESLHENRKLIDNIAKERIMAELNKLMLGKNSGAVLEEYADVISVIIPEIIQMIGFNQNNPHNSLDVWKHTLLALGNTPNDLISRLAIFFHDIAKPKCYECDEKGIGHFPGHAEHSAEMTRIIMRRLKYDNCTTSSVCQLVKFHDAEINPQEKYIKRWLNKIGENQLKRLTAIKRSDVMGQSEYKKEEKLQKLNLIEESIEKVLTEQQCYTLKDLAVNGADLLELGIVEGKKIGDTLNILLDQVLDGTLENERLCLLRAIMSNQK